MVHNSRHSDLPKRHRYDRQASFDDDCVVDGRGLISAILEDKRKIQEYISAHHVIDCLQLANVSIEPQDFLPVSGHWRLGCTALLESSDVSQ